MQTLRVIFFHTADSGVGRCALSDLSEQARMELVVADLSEASKSVFCDSNGDFRDVCDWEYVSCDAQGNVTNIQFSSCLSGVIDLRYVPQTVDFLIVERNAKLRGTLDSVGLPPNVTSVELCQNRLTGGVNFCGFPKSTVILLLESNEFSGSCDLTRLPPKLSVFNIAQNHFCGSIALDSLPSKLQHFCISHNDFAGEVRLDTLPQGLKDFDADHNALTGSVSFAALPRALENFWIASNKFYGTICIASVPPQLRYAEMQCNAFTGEISFVCQTQAHFDFSDNQLSGTALVHRALAGKVKLERNKIALVAYTDGPK